MGEHNVSIFAHSSSTSGRTCQKREDGRRGGGRKEGRKGGRKEVYEAPGNLETRDSELRESGKDGEQAKEIVIGQELLDESTAHQQSQGDNKLDGGETLEEKARDVRRRGR